MKWNQLLVLSSLIFGLGSTAFAGQCLEACQHQKSLSDFRKTVADDSILGPEDRGCPAAGSEISEEGRVQSGSLLSAEGALKKVAEELAPIAKKRGDDQSKCGPCQQVNQITLTSVSRPQTNGTDQVCASKGSSTVDGDFSDAQTAQKFIKQTLDGDNNEGQKIYRACEDPCSFYVYQGQSALPNGKTRVHMTVRCGQPRGSLFAKYTYSSALVHEWTCKKK